MSWPSSRPCQVWRIEMGLKAFLRQDMAMDLGTANTLIHVPGEGVILEEPTVIALSAGGGVLEVGGRARSWLGKTPAGIRAVRPMKDGVIEDFEATSLFIKAILARARKGRGVMAPHLVIGVPSHITQVEKRAVIDAGREAGAGKVYLLDEIMAAAIGGGVPMDEKTPSMILDVGGGTSELAVIQERAYVETRAIRVAGDELDQAIVEWMAAEHGLVIGPAQAEALKWNHGSVWSFHGDDHPVEVAGKDAVSGRPATVMVDPVELRQALIPPTGEVASMVEGLLDDLPARTRDEVFSQGVTLAGGGTLLKGFAAFIWDRTGLKCRMAPDPMRAVVLGAGKAVADLPGHRDLFSN